MKNSAESRAYVWVGVKVRLSAVGNYPGNPIKYAGPGGVEIAVADSGPGVRPKEAVPIWEPFYRGAQFNTAPAPGSGLGLAIVALLAESAGWRVGVRKSAAGGAAFFVLLTTNGLQPGGDRAAEGVPPS